MLKTAFKLGTAIFFAGPVTVIGAIFLYHWHILSQLDAPFTSGLATHVSHTWLFGSWLSHALAVISLYSLCLAVAMCVLAVRRRLQKRRSEA